MSKEKCPHTVPEWHKRNLVTLTPTEVQRQIALLNYFNLDRLLWA